MENYSTNGSGWVLNRLINIDINFLKYNPLRASSYIKMPEKLGYAYDPKAVKNPWQGYNSWADYWHTLSYAAHDISREFRVPVLCGFGWCSLEVISVFLEVAGAPWKWLGLSLEVAGVFWK